MARERALRMPDNTGKEKEGILDLGPERSCRPLTEPWVSEQVSRRKKKFLKADEAASENKRFYLVGNRAKHREICFVWVDKISNRKLNSGQESTIAFPHN